MSASRLGPKEIYNPYRYSQHDATSTEKYKKVEAFCSIDSIDSIEKFKNFYQSESTGQFLNGQEKIHNILITAAKNINLHLVTYIAEHADPAILNMRDSNGSAAIHYIMSANTSEHSIEKIIACADVLIRAGADMDAREHYIHYHARKLPPAEIALDDAQFKGQNSLGYIARKLTNRKNSILTQEIKKLKLLAKLLISHGATRAYEGCWENCPVTYLGWYTIDKPITNTNLHKSQLISTLQPIRQQVHEEYWSKVKWLICGRNSPTSPLNSLPEDVFKIIFQATNEQIRDFHL